MFRFVVSLAIAAAAVAFAPAGRTVQRRYLFFAMHVLCLSALSTHTACGNIVSFSIISLSMGIENFIGAPAKNELGGFFDPLGLSKDKDDATLSWYRAAELKHGRVSMLATLGIVFQGLGTASIPGFTTAEKNGFTALKVLYYENPASIAQVSFV